MEGFSFVKGNLRKGVFYESSIVLRPLSLGIDRIAIIDQVIAYLQTQSVTMVGDTLETVLEGGLMSPCAFSKEVKKWQGIDNSPTMSK